MKKQSSFVPVAVLVMVLSFVSGLMYFDYLEDLLLLMTVVALCVPLLSQAKSS